MKTETQIAQEKVKDIYDTVALTQKGILREQAREHKAAYQRFLDFLEDLNLEVYLHQTNTKLREYQNKITDLKQAIKLYEDAGI